MICSKSKLDQELGKIHSILLENGYLECAINLAFQQKLQQLNSNLVHTVKKCPLYLHIPWIGNVSMKFEKQIMSAVKRCFFSVEPRVIFNTRQLFPAIKKDVLPSIITAILFTSFCATVIVGTLVGRLNGYKSKLNNMFLDPSLILLPWSTAKVFAALARPTHAHNNFTNLPLVNIFLTMPNVPFITAMKNFLFSLKVALLFTFLLLKQVSLNLSIPFCVSKKKLSTL